MDPDTTSMYDDGHVYSKPGQYVASAAADYPKTDKIKQNIDKVDTTQPASPDAPVELGVLAQKKSHDTFDIDDKNEAEPHDASMYDDQHTYFTKPGTLKNIQINADE